jgi:hypothetical protein
MTSFVLFASSSWIFNVIISSSSLSLLDQTLPQAGLDH